MIEREAQERSHTELVIVKVTCDRCGNNVRRMSGFVTGEYPFDGVYVRGFLYPTGNAADAKQQAWQLCATCTEDLHEWIGSDGDPKEGL